MTTNPSVLLACPTSDHKKYCQDDWLENVKKINYPNLQILIVDNSKSEDNAKYIRSKGIECIWDKQSNPKQDIRYTILSSTKKIESEVKKRKVDYWFSYESDIFAMPDVIQRLLEHNRRVISFPYFVWIDNEQYLLHFGFENVNGIYISHMPSFEESISWIDGTVKQSYQTGLGCHLIHKSVFDYLHIRYNANEFKIGFPDSFFHFDCLNKGIPVFVDTSDIVHHINNSDRWKLIDKTILH